MTLRCIAIIGHQRCAQRPARRNGDLYVCTRHGLIQMALIDDMLSPQTRRMLAGAWWETVTDAQRLIDRMADVFARTWPNSPHAELIATHQAARLKAAVPANNFDGVAMPSDLSRPFLATADASSVVPRVGGVRVPFDLGVPVETSRIVGDFVTPGHAKPLTASAFVSVTLVPAKVVATIVVPEELLRKGGPAAEAFLRRRLPPGVARGMDAAFANPDHASAVTVDATPIDASGSPDDDLRNLLADYVAHDGAVESAVLVRIRAFEQVAGSDGLYVTSRVLADLQRPRTGVEQAGDLRTAARASGDSPGKGFALRLTVVESLREKPLNQPRDGVGRTVPGGVGARAEPFPELRR
jgi:hypothetical protein